MIDSFCSTPFNTTHTHCSRQLGKQQRQQVRMLNVHEYVGSDIMKSFGIETPVVGRPSLLRVLVVCVASVGRSSASQNQSKFININPIASQSGTMQGQVVSSVDEAEHAYMNVLNKGDAVVKAQVPCSNG